MYILVFYFCCVLSLAGQCCLLIASATLNKIYLISHHKPYICIMHACQNGKPVKILIIYSLLWLTFIKSFHDDQILGMTPCAVTHYSDAIMCAIASQITSLAIVYSAVYSGADQRKHQSSASLAFVGGIHRWPVNSPHKGPVTRKMFPFDDVITKRYLW